MSSERGRIAQILAVKVLCLGRDGSHSPGEFQEPSGKKAPSCDFMEEETGPLKGMFLEQNPHPHPSDPQDFTAWVFSRLLPEDHPFLTHPVPEWDSAVPLRAAGVPECLGWTAWGRPQGQHLRQGIVFHVVHVAAAWEGTERGSPSHAFAVWLRDALSCLGAFVQASC